MVIQPILFNPSWFVCYTMVYKDKTKGKKITEHTNSIN